MKSLPAVLATILVFLSLLVHPARAQSKGAADANEAAYTLFSAGDYSGAEAAYEKLLKDYPTDVLVPVATIQLAYSQFFQGKFDTALANLKKATSTPLPAELSEVADTFLPQVLSAKASAMPAGDAQRKPTFEQAIAKFTEFVTKYPNSPEIENAIYGRAIANYQIENFDKAIEDLRLNLQRFPQSPTISASRNLLALSLATLGSRQLVNPNGDRAKGMEQLTEAEKLLREVIANRRDIGLINDSYFQIGEILFTKGAFDEGRRTELYGNALEAYRAILPKDEVLAMQRERIAAFPSQKAAALAARNLALKKQLDKDNERELRKLSEIEAKPDQTASAMLKMAEIYFNAQDYNAARTLMRHVNPFLSKDDEKLRSLYYTTMTYALQGQVDKAVESYKNFTSAHKGAPIAENLPFAMGSMFLSAGKPEEAITYFDESITQYPTGRFIGLSVVSKAQAQASLRQFDEALKTFQTHLAKNPPADVAVVAQYGLAGIYKDKGQWDQAIAEYQKVKERFAGTPQATESAYWIAIATQQKGDNAGAIPLLEAFAKANPTHALTPLALYALGTAQLASGRQDDAVATLARIADEFPQSQPAPFTYFLRAQVRAQEQKADDVTSLMRQFIEKYPRDDKIFFAFDSIAQTALNSGKPDEAVATYLDFSERYSDHPKAAEALVKAADLQRGNAERIAMNYAALEAADQTRWKDAIQQSLATAASVVQKYPDSADVSLAMQSALASQQMLRRAELRQPAEVEKYFEEIAASAPSEAAKSRVSFALAGFLNETDPKRALAKMNEAYKPDLVYSPKDLDAYGLALIDAGKLDEATAVFQKLQKDYALPVGVAANQIPLQVQEAQAIALFGLGRVAQEKKQTAESGKLFGQLKALYPWSPKVLEADYGIAESLRAQGKGEEAQQILTTVIRAQNASAELRANSFLMLGEITEGRMGAEADPAKKADLLGAAIDAYLKIAQFYGGVPDAAAAGLWRGGQLLEQQSGESKDAAFKAQQLNRARDAYRQLVKDYPQSELSSKAQARLSALGAP